MDKRAEIRLYIFSGIFGALGAISRALLTDFMNDQIGISLWSIAAINLIGTILLALSINYYPRIIRFKVFKTDLPPLISAFLGAFTTFSTVISLVCCPIQQWTFEQPINLIIIPVSYLVVSWIMQTRIKSKNIDLELTEKTWEPEESASILD